MASLFEKIWERHLVIPETCDLPAIIYVDLHLLHEVTSPQAFLMLKQRSLKIRCPEKTLATADHAVPSSAWDELQFRKTSFSSWNLISKLRENCQEAGIPFLGPNHLKQGIVHVIGPELGLTQPGKLIVCGDSHTSTHGAFGALAFGIGSTEVSHVLATQCLLQRQPRQMRVSISGEMKPFVSAKDIALHLIRQLGSKGGVGYVIELTGSVIESMNMTQRMTLCNMMIETGARSGIIAPDATTYSYLRERYQGSENEFMEYQQQLKYLFTDEDHCFDKEVNLDISDLEPMVSYGTSPAMSICLNERIPLEPDSEEIKALQYMNFQPGTSVLGQPVDVVFIGSCTNGRFEDLKKAAEILRGKKIASHVKLLVVPGSQKIKKEIENQGFDRIFIQAGAIWGEPGCSMCNGINGDTLQPGQLAVSTTNRNFVGRQGQGGRTVLASPDVAIASAIQGRISHPASLCDL